MKYIISILHLATTAGWMALCVTSPSLTALSDSTWLVLFFGGSIYGGTIAAISLPPSA